jgi:hypothetical protein
VFTQDLRRIEHKLLSISRAWVQFEGSNRGFYSRVQLQGSIRGFYSRSCEDRRRTSIANELGRLFSIYFRESRREIWWTFNWKHFGYLPGHKLYCLIIRVYMQTVQFSSCFYAHSLNATIYVTIYRTTLLYMVKTIIALFNHIIRSHYSLLTAFWNASVSLPYFVLHPNPWKVHDSVYLIVYFDLCDFWKWVTLANMKARRMHK